MNILMIIRVAFRALVRNKMRAALTMLGIIIGVSAVIAMVSIGQGAQASVQAQIEGMGTNLLFVSAGAQNVGGVRSGAGDGGTNTLTVDDLEAIRREVPSVAMVTPTVNARSQLVVGNQNWSTTVQGVSEQYPGSAKMGCRRAARSLPKQTCAQPRASSCSDKPSRTISFPAQTRSGNQSA